MEADDAEAIMEDWTLEGTEEELTRGIPSPAAGSPPVSEPSGRSTVVDWERTGGDE
jgi:hypothetical protein